MNAVELLDKLDGIRLNKKKFESAPQRMEDYLQLPDDYESRTSQPGKKRVTSMSLYCLSLCRFPGEWVSVKLFLDGT